MSRRVAGPIVSFQGSRRSVGLFCLASACWSWMARRSSSMLRTRSADNRSRRRLPDRTLDRDQIVRELFRGDESQFEAADVLAFPCSSGRRVEGPRLVATWRARDLDRWRDQIIATAATRLVLRNCNHFHEHAVDDDGFASVLANVCDPDFDRVQRGSRRPEEGIEVTQRSGEVPR
jgi:hypothetical protein